MSRSLLLILLAAFAPFISHAEPRTDVDSIAALIESKYFDPERGKTIADDLRKAATNGAFDRYSEPGDLAVELSRRLRALDGHFNVQWSATEPPQPRSSSGSALPESRSNYGFARVERLPGNVAYIDLTYAAHIVFTDKDSASRRAADAALALCHDADAVIIDLRRNGGGSPAMVGYVVSAFVEPAADVYNSFHSRQGVTSERPQQTYAKPMLSVPLYVLTSGRTGSAAESIAFTLQSAGRAVVVGERSGGAANPGARFRTEQGYSVFISTGSPRNPLNGSNWEGDGVKPDVNVAVESAVHRAHELALEKVLSGSIEGASRKDAQWMLDALRARAQPPAISAGSIDGEFGPYRLEATANAIHVTRGRWPAMKLLPLSEDLYFFEHDPSRRVSVERKDGRVAAIRILSPDGNEQRLSRSEADPAIRSDTR